MEKIKVLHCLHSQSWGGLEIYTVDLVTKMQEAGLSQKVLCAASSRVAEELKKRNIEIITFPEERLSKWRHARLIHRLLKTNSFTHLHSHARLDMWACALARWNQPQVKHFYNLYMNATPKRDFVHKWLFSKVDLLCSSSETILNEVKKNFPIDFHKLRLVRYGRELEQYKPNPEGRRRLREQFGVREDQIVFGTLCRIDPGKGVRELAKALEYLNDPELARVQLWIVGDPTTIGKNADGSPIYEEPSRELQNWLQEFQKQPRYKDHLVHLPFQKDYITVIDALDVFALASYNETYSLSVLDAMIMQKPVIGTDAGGTPEQIGANERGLLAEPKDAESLSLALRHYLRHPEDILTQGEKASGWARRQHDWKLVVQQYKDLYEGSLGDHL